MRNNKGLRIRKEASLSQFLNHTTFSNFAMAKYNITAFFRPLIGNSKHRLTFRNTKSEKIMSKLDGKIAKLNSSWKNQPNYPQNMIELRP